ncbi:MAG: gliding motility-associated C-terminal domain-containing protein [Bacteroidota bacterium]
MKKRNTIRLSIIYIVLHVLFLPFRSFSQLQCNIFATAADTVVCNSDSVHLFSNGSIYTLEMSNNFDDGTIGSGWAATSSATVTSSMCVPHPSATNYLWMANTPAPRSFESIDFDVHNGGFIQWDMRYAIQGNASPCEGPDQPDEGVALQFSTNGGGMWTDWKYFQPDGSILISNPFVTSPSVNNGQTTLFTNWSTQNWPIPAAAQTSATRFRWFQANATGAEYDNWGIEDIKITSSQPSHLHWVASPAAYISNDTVANPTAFITQTTTFTVTISNGIDSCFSSITITVAPPPTSFFTVDSPVCTSSNSTITYTGNAPATATYNWNFDGGAVVSGTGQGPYEINWITPGIHNVSLTVEVGDCQSQPSSVTVNVYEMTAQINVIDSLTCNGVSNGSAAVAVTGGMGSLSYVWNTTPQQYSSTAVGLAAQVPYSVTTTDQYGCVVTESITLTQPAPIELYTSNDTTVCDGSVVNLSAYATGGTMPYTYSWSNASSGSNTTITTAGNITMTVTATDNDLCSVSETIQILTIPLNGDITADTLSDVISHEFLFSWNGDVASNYVWNFGDGTTGTGISVSHIYAEAGTYIVTLTATGNLPEGCIYTFTILIEVIYPSLIEIPNVFTPNGDGMNDYFMIKHDGEFLSFNCSIFSRWGNLVFQTEIPDFKWDGNGQSDGVYFYIIDAEATDKKVYSLKGNVTIIR